jgi:hypothetical protein
MLSEMPMKLRGLIQNSLISFCLATGLITALALIIRMIKQNTLEYFEQEQT